MMRAFGYHDHLILLNVLKVVVKHSIKSNGHDSQMLSLFYARYSGRPVGRRTHPVGREEGILVVITLLVLQHTALALNSV